MEQNFNSEQQHNVEIDEQDLVEQKLRAYEAVIQGTGTEAIRLRQPQRQIDQPAINPSDETQPETIENEQSPEEIIENKIAEITGAIMLDPHCPQANLSRLQVNLKEEGITNDQIDKIFAGIYESFGIDKESIKKSYDKLKTDKNLIWIAVPTNNSRLWLRVGYSSPADQTPRLSLIQDTEEDLLRTISAIKHNTDSHQAIGSVFGVEDTPDPEDPSEIADIFIDEVRNSILASHINFFLDSFPPDQRTEIFAKIIEKLGVDQTQVENAKNEASNTKQQKRSSQEISRGISTNLPNKRMIIIATDDPKFQDGFVYRVVD